MAQYIKTIKVNSLFHLKGFEIPVGNEKNPHLLITGKNGSGKTVLLNAVADVFDIIKGDMKLAFMGYYDNLEREKANYDKTSNIRQKALYKENIRNWENKIEKLYGKVIVEIPNIVDIIEKYDKERFIIVFYPAGRRAEFEEPESIQKPVIVKKTRVRQTNTHQLLKYLSHNKVQGMFAKVNGNKEKEAALNNWFANFERIIKTIFDDENLRICFNENNYSFTIETNEKRFDFNHLSDGYSAVLNIVADLILRMQGNDSVTADFDMEGIVLIDEIETHLHLELQKNVMPLLTALFPNIQFIVTTHSPFVLSSMKNAMAYDLEHREPVDNLTQYSYESLAEGYFGVTNESGYIQDQLSLMEELLKNDNLRDSQKNDLKRMIADFEKIPSAVAPTVVGQYRKLRNDYFERIKDLGI